MNQSKNDFTLQNQSDTEPGITAREIRLALVEQLTFIRTGISILSDKACARGTTGRENSTGPDCWNGFTILMKEKE